MSEQYLTSEDVVILTGRRNMRQQVEQLQKMGILFSVNFIGKPIVPIASVEGPITRARAEVKALDQHFSRLRKMHNLPD
ncbi:hypothetical protein AAKU55_003180 [Oxalobacteraceae bacterium GrIS 1.11]